MNSHSVLSAAAIALLSQTIQAAPVVEPAKPDSTKADNEIIVKATPLPMELTDVIQPITVLDGDALQRMLSSSIGETIAKQPGITGTYFGPNASRPVIRGLSGERVQMLEDGAGALDVSSLSEDHAVSIEDAIAEGIEIIKGPATLLYGSGAVGGVVNILTGRVPEKLTGAGPTGAVEARAGTGTTERTGAGRLDFGIGSFAVHMDAYKRRTEEVEVPGFVWSQRARAAVLAVDPSAELPRDEIPNSAGKSSGGAFGASWIGSRGFIGAAWSRFDTLYQVPQPPGDEIGGPRIDMSQDRYDLKAGIDGSTNGWFRKLTLRASRNDYAHAELEPDGAIGTQFLQTGDEARAALEHAVGTLRGIVGAQYRHLDLQALGDESFLPPTVTRTAGLFVFEQYPLNDALIFEGGLRSERQTVDPQDATSAEDYSANSLSGSLGALWKFRPALALAVNVTRSQRHPTASELFADGAHEATAQYVIGSTALNKETANTFDLGLRGSGAIRWNLSAYMNEFRDYIFLSPTPNTIDDLPVFEYRQDNARLTGAEAEMTLPLLKKPKGTLELRVAADYVRGKLTNGGNLPQIPPLKAGADLIWTTGRWQAQVSGFHFNRQNDLAAYETPTNGYTMLDASVSYRHPWGSAAMLFFLRGDNLTDVEARRHTSPLKEFAPLPGRSLLGGVRVQF